MNIPKITQKELAEYLGTHRNTLIRWDKGLSSPSVDKIKKLRKRAERNAMTFEEFIAECDRVIARSEKITNCFRK